MEQLSFFVVFNDRLKISDRIEVVREMRRLTSFFLAAILVFLFAAGALASTNHKAEFKIGLSRYTVNNTEFSMDAAPFIKNGRTYVPVRYLAYSCGIDDSGVTWDFNTKTATLSKENTTLKIKVGDLALFISNNPEQALNYKKVQMDVVPLLIEGRIYLPARYVAEAFGYKIDFNEKQQAVKISSNELSPVPEPEEETMPESVLKSISGQEDNNTSVITIQSEKEPLRYKIFSLNNPDRLVIDLEGIAPGQVPEIINFSSPLIDSIRVGWFSKNPDATRVVLDLKDKVKYSSAILDNSKKLRLVVRERGNSLSGAVIVLDPGHGGSDPGAIGPSKVREKDINLAIALKTAQYLRNQGAKVVLTRSNDTYIGLYERPEIANQNGADVFLSIHCNAHISSSANGTSTYHLRSQINDMYEVRAEGISLAKHIQSALVGTIKRADRGVLQADFVVLKNSWIPAALAEIAFISNPEEESLLANSASQDKIAQALVKGTEAYLADR